MRRRRGLPPSLLRARAVLAQQLRQALRQGDSERLARLVGILLQPDGA